MFTNITQVMKAIEVEADNLYVGYLPEGGLELVETSTSGSMECCWEQYTVFYVDGSKKTVDVTNDPNVGVVGSEEHRIRPHEEDRFNKATAFYPKGLEKGESLVVVLRYHDDRGDGVESWVNVIVYLGNNNPGEDK